MKEKVTILKPKVYEETTITNIICDFCGRHFQFDDAISEGVIEFGYGSKYDGDRVYFDICDDCFDKILKNKISEWIERSI